MTARHRQPRSVGLPDAFLISVALAQLSLWAHRFAAALNPPHTGFSSLTIEFFSTPMPSISISTTSPALRKTGGLRATPTP